MARKRRKSTPMNIVGGPGLVLAIGGIVNLYPLGWGLALAFAVWILGAVLVNFPF